MSQLVLIGIYGAINKIAENPRVCSTQYVDITTNGRPARAMVDKSGKVNIMTKTAAIRLGLRYTPGNAQLRTVNEPPTQMPGVAQGVSTTLGELQGNTNFTKAYLDLLNIIIGQEFFH